eukprot:7689508-Pyramimonas_sp.AAC.1
MERKRPREHKRVPHYRHPRKQPSRRYYVCDEYRTRVQLGIQWALRIHSSTFWSSGQTWGSN